MDPLSEPARRFLAGRRVGHLATADARAAPHVVPVCFILADSTLYITIDQKPKRGAPLKRLRNIAENPAVARFEDQIQPILMDYCYRCHAQGTKKGGVAFDEFGSGEAFLKDLPNAQMHRLEAGHFAVEDSLTTIVDGMIHFYNDNVAGKEA